MEKNLKNKKAFTLTELIVVIAIIGILAAVLIPSLTGYIEKAKESTALQEAHAITSAYDVWFIKKEAGMLEDDKETEKDESSFEVYVKTAIDVDIKEVGGNYIYTASNKLGVKLIIVNTEGNHLIAEIEKK